MKQVLFADENYPFKETFNRDESGLHSQPG